MRTRTRHLLRVLGVIAGVGLASHLVTDARGDSVVQFMTAKSLPDATVDVIDPESGTSTGTSGSDVNLAVGDIILFRFSVGNAPASAVRGIQAYVTEYLPPNTELVGVRIIDEDGNTIEPRRAGLALDGCAGGSACNTVAGHQTGSIAQVYADTGVFFSNDPFTGPTPDNEFLTLDEGIELNPEPRNIDPEIVQLLNDTSGTYYAHNDWDWDQVRAFGGASSPFANGDGNTPHRYGSPVAGPDTHYGLEASRSGGTVALSGVEGPWERIFYPGSQIGTGVGDLGSTNNMTRVGVDTAAGFDVTPATPVDATAVRFALGETWVGEVRHVEVAVRVTGVPIDPTFGTGAGNVDCGEAFGSEIASKSANTGGATNPWPSYIAHPQCVFLRLKLDLDVDKTLADASQQLNYAVFGKNLSIDPETNARVRLKFVGSDQAFLGSTPPPDATFTCPGETNKTCLEYQLGTLAPSDEFNIDVDMDIGGVGGGTNVFVAQYLSNELTAIDPNGYQTTAMTVVQPAALPILAVDNALDVTATGNFASPGTDTWQITGTVRNDGTATWTSENFTIRLPSATWGLRNAAGTTNNRITVGGVDATCSSAGLERVCSIGQGYTMGQQRTIAFRLIVPTGQATGLYDLDIHTRGNQGTFGSFETDFRKAVTVPVGAIRSVPPVLQCQPPLQEPIGSSAPSIHGTSEADAAIALFFNLMERGDGVAAAAPATTAPWTVSNYLPGFGELYGGLEVRATAQQPGELESKLSLPCTVVTTKACSDGLDNDGDGQIDFPADPGCASSTDNSEADPPRPQCSDDIDNNGSGGTDWPDDPSCTDPDDPTEDGVPACDDGVDNDGDGDVDFPDDSDCTSATDGTEVRYRQCQDGLDNDGDGLIDFDGHGAAGPDTGCHSRFDDLEFDDGSSTIDTKARLLIALDSSGSMNWHTCDDEFTGGDGSTECAGGDVACTTCDTGVCDNAQPDDSRLYQVKAGLSNVVAAFGEVEYSLMRFHQRAMPFDCPGALAGQQSGGWQGGGAAPCGGGFAAGDLLVSFAQENEATILDWMNHDSDYDGVAPIGTDFEVRGSGTTPLAGILTSANDYLDGVRADDLRSACRPYRVILVTDGAETCGGSPTDAAGALLADGIAVHVIGFATPDPTVIANLDAIAAAGGTTSAIFVDDEAALSAAIARIIEDSILVETCNGLDDDCDDLTDEDFPELGETCDNGEAGQCFQEGVRVCRDDELATACDAPPGTPSVEACNGLDDDCDEIIDEDTGPSCTCNPLPEICNGADDDCDDRVDEDDPLPGEGQACGLDIGVCEPGQLVCTAGALVCAGDVEPGVEVCDDADNDCDTFTDEVAAECYEFATGCTDLDGDGNFTCVGLCQEGIRGCAGGAPGACEGDVGPVDDVCNGLDDDCDGETDEDFDLGAACDNGLEGDCLATGILVCDGAGGVRCTAPNIPPGIETCDDRDNDCDGDVDEELGSPIGDTCGGGGACSVGTFECVDGEVTCVGEQTGTAELCNGDDDDCDLSIDEDVPGMGGDCVPTGFEAYCDVATGECVGQCDFGHLECDGGAEICREFRGPVPEIPCDGIDQDCDGDDSVICPDPEQACVEGGCRDRCGDSEFPCPLGYVCENVGADRYCVPDVCFDVDCAPGFECDPETGACVDRCDGVTCADPLRCVNGLCQDCFVFGCEDGERCVRDTSGIASCIVDRCFDVTCEGDTSYCDAATGACVDVGCDPACGNGEICRDGACVVDPCGGACPEGQFCDIEDERCEPDPCVGLVCDAGELCNPYENECVVAACPACPDGFDCVVQPDGTPACQTRPRTPTEQVFAGGGGCRSTGDASTGLATLLLLGVTAALGLRRRQPVRVRARRR